MHASDTGTGTYDTDTNGVHLIVFKVVILAITQNSRDSDSVLKKLFFTSTQPPDPITLTHPSARTGSGAHQLILHLIAFILVHRHTQKTS